VKLDLPDEYVPVTIRALEHYGAYLKATNRDDRLATGAAEAFRAAERKGPGKEEATTVKKKRA
jgi:hypothetical protein